MRFALWRKPDAPTPPPKDDRPDPDVQQRMADARVALSKMVAAEALRTAAESSRRAGTNHITEAIIAWAEQPSNHHPRRKMPPRKAS